MEKKDPIAYFFLAALLGALSPYLYLSFFAHPIADDYCFAVLVPERALTENFSRLYLKMGGRYTTNALLLLNPLSFQSLTVYQVIPILQILLAIFSFYYFFRSITSRAFSVISSLNASILFVLLYLSMMPSLAEGIYSYTAAMDYHAGLIPLLVYFGLLHDYYRGRFIAHRLVHLLVCIVFLIICIGFCEVQTLALIFFHPALLFLFYKQGKKPGGDWVLIVLVCLVFSLIMLLAPGNSVRSLKYPDNHDLLSSLAFSFMQSFRFGFDWISSLALVLSALIFCFLAAAKKEGMPFFRQSYFFSPWISALILFFILFLSVFPPYWGTGILGQHRTVNVGCFLFMLYFFISAGIHAIQYMEKAEGVLRIGNNTRPLLLVLLLCMIAATRNGYSVCTDIINQKAEAFDTQMQERFDLLKRPGSQGETIYLKPLTEKPASLFILDLSDDPEHWINRCQAKYFGVKEIICKE